MIRLDRLLASLGLGSHQEVKALVRQGRVMVAGDTALDPAMGVTPEDPVYVDGTALDTRLERHVMMHKPQGLLIAARDARHPTVMGLLPPLYQSLGCMPVGRLDKDIQGLLLFTTEGKAAHRLLSPRHGVDKVYQARVTGHLQAVTIQRFLEGIPLKDFITLPAELTILEAAPEESLAQVTVREGKYHQVRRMFRACGHEVIHLTRLAFGPLRLDPALAPGQWRELTAAEWQALTKEGTGHD